MSVGAVQFLKLRSDQPDSVSVDLHRRHLDADDVPFCINHDWDRLRSPEENSCHSEIVGYGRQARRSSHSSRLQAQRAISKAARQGSVTPASMKSCSNGRGLANQIDAIDPEQPHAGVESGLSWTGAVGVNAVCSLRRARMPPRSRTSSDVLRWQSLYVASRSWVAKAASGSSLRFRCSPAACNQANQSASLILSSHGCQRGSACKSRSSGSTFIDARPASRCRCARSSHSNARSASLWYACACAI